jgi:hypothetical protein
MIGFFLMAKRADFADPQGKLDLGDATHG